jgi:hypothetical protein
VSLKHRRDLFGFTKQRTPGILLRSLLTVSWPQDGAKPGGFFNMVSPVLRTRS